MKKIKPYYAVIFTSTLTEAEKDYHKMAELMETLAKEQKGFLGLDSAREIVGITVSYWKNLEAIQRWKQNTDHLIAQKKGKTDWYSWYNIKICKVEGEYEFHK